MKLHPMSTRVGGLLALALVAAASDATAQDESAETPSVAKALDRSAAITRCVEILLQRQENLDAANGSGPVFDGDPREWPYQGVYRVRERGSSVIPLGYRVGGTSIAAWALLEAPGWKEDAARRAAVERALDFVLDTADHPLMSADFREGYDVRGWGHAYALHFLVRLHELDRVPEERAEALRRTAESLSTKLADSVIAEKGGWNYSRRRNPAPSTFMTGSTLQALFAAKANGIGVSAEPVSSSLSALEQSRLESGAFQYSLSSRRTGTGFEAVEGSTGRSPICESTLLLSGRGSVDRVRVAVRDFFEHWQFLEDRRQKTGTHEPPFMIAPYYFFYAHFYVAQAIELLPDAERAALRAKLERRLAEVREESGGWNDRVFDRSENFGTAMALLALCARDMPRPHGWSTEKAPR